MTRTRSISLIALCSSIAASFAACSEDSPDDGTNANAATSNTPSATGAPSTPTNTTGAGPTGAANPMPGIPPSTPGAMAGATGAMAGATGAMAGATGAMAGATGAMAGATGSTAGPTGSTAGPTGSTAGETGTDGDSGDTAGDGSMMMMGAGGAGGMSGLGGEGGAGGDAGVDGEGGAGGGGPTEPEMSSTLSAGCGTEPGIGSDMYNNGNPISISAAGRDRRYILSVPDGYDNNTPYNLVIAWHQLDGNDKQMFDQNYYWIRDIPEAASSTIFVAPNGEKNGQPCTGMGVAESGCGWPDSSGSNVALADAVVAEVEANFCIDKTRIFANGWSYGGSMSYRTACSRPIDGDEADWGVRGVAVYNGMAQLSSGNCQPSKAVAFYGSHGTDDNVLPYDSGVQMATTYAGLNGCNSMMPTRSNGNHVCTNYMGCTDGFPVEFCSFVGPHTPDPQEGGQRWQPQEVWQFWSNLSSP